MSDYTVMLVAEDGDRCEMVFDSYLDARKCFDVIDFPGWLCVNLRGPGVHRIRPMKETAGRKVSWPFL